MSNTPRLNLKFAVSVIIAIGAVLAFNMTTGYAGGKGDHGHGDTHASMGHGGMAGGEPGKASDVSRTITVIATELKFEPNVIKVKAGETVRLVLKNKGELVHELSIGTPAMQKDHQVQMQKMMDDGKLEADRIVGDMKHGHGNSAMVAPGKTKELIWKFARDTSLEFGCNIPGHYEGGMKGKFKFEG